MPMPMPESRAGAWCLVAQNEARGRWLVWNCCSSSTLFRSPAPRAIFEAQPCCRTFKRKLQVPRRPARTQSARTQSGPKEHHAWHAHSPLNLLCIMPIANFAPSTPYPLAHSEEWWKELVSEYNAIVKAFDEHVVAFERTSKHSNLIASCHHIDQIGRPDRIDHGERNVISPGRKSTMPWSSRRSSVPSVTA